MFLGEITQVFRGENVYNLLPNHSTRKVCVEYKHTKRENENTCDKMFNSLSNLGKAV